MFNYLKEILFLLGDSKKKIPILIIFFILTSLLDLIGIGLIGPYIAIMIDESNVSGLLLEVVNFLNLPKERERLALYISFVILVVFIFKAIANIWINRIIIKFGLDQQLRLRSFLMNAYQSLPYIKYTTRNSSEYIYNIQHLTGQYSNSVVIPLLRIISNGIVTVFIVVLLSFQNFSALMLLVTLLLIMVVGYDKIFRSKAKSYGKESNDASTDMIQAISEGIEGLKEIRVLSKEKHFHNRVYDSANKFSKYNLKVQILHLLPRNIVEPVLIGFIILLVIITLSTNGDIKALVPTLGVFGIAAIRLLPSVSILSAGLVGLRYARNGISRLYKDVNNVSSGLASEKFSCLKKELLGDSFQKLLLDKISFSYPGIKSATLRNVSLTVKRGEAVGLIGRSGSGKSTLIDLILGMISPDSGSIKYNDKNLDESISKWREQVAYLPQQIFLIDNSLRCNIALGVEESQIDDSKIDSVIRQSLLAKMVQDLPKGINTSLGEKGIKLSGGQRQRVALARAFYHNRDVLIMDEATSSLDNETEQEIVKEIKYLKKDKTLIVVAHRLTTLQSCDKIYELDGGELTLIGSYDDLSVNKTQ